MTLTPSPPPIVRVTRRFTFSAAHRYGRPEWSEAQNRAHYGPLAAIHGHTYTLEVTLQGAVDPRTGMLVDLGEVKRLVGETVLSRFDHAFLNDTRPALYRPEAAADAWRRLLVFLRSRLA